MIRANFLILVATIVLGACAAVRPSGTSPEASLRLYVFDCGKLRVDGVEFFGIPDDATAVRELAVPCYVVEHDKGRLLWDGGLVSSVADTPGWHRVRGNEMRLDRKFADQIAEVGLDMGSFDYVAFSHMHFDHIGVANELRGATHLIQKDEYDAAFADPVTVPFYVPADYAGLREARTLVIEGDHDVFGDGRVQILSAPGHTPGHQVLFVDLPRTGPLVLSGDLYHFRVSREDRYVPQFNFDRERTLQSMTRVEEFVADKNASFWIEHDLAAFTKQKKAPEFYD